MTAQIISAELLKEEEAEIVQIIEHSPSIVVFGQTPYAKARIVNELFGKSVLPSLEDVLSDKSLRMVKFKHGNNSMVYLTLPDDYDLVETLEADNGPWNTIPQRDLIVTETEGGDNALGLAHLEVTQNHPLLKFGTQVVVGPSMPGGVTEDVVRKCLERAPSILVYGFASDQLHDEVCIYSEVSECVFGGLFLICVS